MTQGIEHEIVEPVEQRERGLRHQIAVGEVREAPQPEAQDIPGPMLQRYRDDLLPAQRKRPGDGPEAQIRDAGDRWFREGQEYRNLFRFKHKAGEDTTEG